LWGAFTATTLRSFLQQTSLGRAYFFQLIFIFISLTIFSRARKVGGIYWSLAFTLLGLVLPVFQSHSSSLSNHSLAIGSLFFHVIFITTWAGGVLGLFLISENERQVSLRRFSAFALWASIAVIASGVFNAYSRLDFKAAWGSNYSILVALKTLLSIMLIGFGARHRKFIAENRADDSRKLLRDEVLVLVTTIALGSWLSTVQPPDHPGEAIKPAIPTWSRLAFIYQPDALFIGFLILISALYFRGVYLLSKRGDKWPLGRSVAFILAVIAVDYATSGGLGFYAQYAFSYHMVAHMVLGMIAPIGFVLSAPATLALRTLPIGRYDDERGIRGTLITLIHSKSMVFYTNPVVVLALFDGSLFLVYMTNLFNNLMGSHSGHMLMNIHFLAAGYLFFHVIIGIDPNPRKLPHIVRIIVLFAAMSIHAFFSIVLLSATTVLNSENYWQPWNLDLLANQHIGASLGWAMGEVPILLALVATFIQWNRDDSREQKRIDRASERAAAMGEDDDLAEYNRFLSQLSAEDKQRGE
jgi:putative copper resistance protein D